MKTLDFSKKKKPTMTITLADGSQIRLRTPSKGILEALTEIKDDIDPDSGIESIDQIYSICHQIMNNNCTGTAYSREDVEKLFDIEDAVTLLGGYAEFVNEVISSKN